MKLKRTQRSFRLLLFLLCVLLLTVAMFFLPESIAGYSLKKVDILSDVRAIAPDDADAADTTDILDTRPSLADSLPEKEQSLVAQRINLRKAMADSVARAAALSDSSALPATVLYDDYSEECNAFQHTYKTLRNGQTLRIAVLGDSFIEGDIITLDVRNQLQERFGGEGVGWVPLMSNIAGFRKGVTHTFQGWSEEDANQKSGGKYFLNEHCYKAEENASVRYRLNPVKIGMSEMTIYYQSNDEIPFSYRVADSTYQATLPAANPIGSFTIRKHTNALGLTFPQATQATFYGVALDGNSRKPGVVVDNFSLRGSSGLALLGLNKAICTKMAQLRPYQLIILQYGLNVMKDTQHNYKSYAEEMVRIINYLKSIYPESDILLLGPSDRAVRSNGELHTMPALAPFTKAMRGVARDTGILFWNLQGAMKSVGGITAFVDRGWAAKDYTHLSFRGGRFLAQQFVNAFLFEYQFYDKAAALTDDEATAPQDTTSQP